MENEAVPKRKRVTQACDSCRSLKSKCDGRQPICNRCEGYGYACRWRDGHRKNSSTSSNVRSSEGELPTLSLDEITSLRQAIRSAHEVLRGLYDKLDPPDQRAVDAVLLDATSSPKSFVSSFPVSQVCGANSLACYPSRSSSTAAYRYLGEVSDVSFFNSVKNVLQSNASSDVEGLPRESYERETLDIEVTADDTCLEMPNRNIADGFVNIYFTTIHIAYPFICRQQFMIEYERFWAPSTTPIVPSSFYSLLLTIFAIGSHYSLCARAKEPSGVSTHASYFRHAIMLYCQLGTEHCIENVSLLLLQCFYLLATCQTDRCWTTLGLAIRTAQSFGLHVEACRSKASAKVGQVTLELNRRTWYSLYVLDRLLSLQLGRPSAIRNRDFQVKLPSRVGDEEFDLSSDRVPSLPSDEAKPGDYFIAVISFSNIIGHVMRDLYQPTMIDYSEDMLSRTDRLDAELLSWRNRLPRWLRFDRGHTFEQAGMLKRQRNMLGIKFHHLRALIHRPYLCLPWLQNNDSNIKHLLDLHSQRVVLSESICVREAQETAHMLHDVTDKKSLVEDFPWWQMISCLICASSILLVMRAFVAPPVEHDCAREVLEDDANTCLKVFDALSANSEAAQLASDMLQNLREIRTQYQRELDEGMMPSSDLGSDEDGNQLPESRDVQARFSHASADYIHNALSENGYLETNGQLPPSTPWNWPSEIANSMAWSFQFVDTIDPAILASDHTNS